MDVVLTGSLLRTRDRFRVRAELVAVPAGDVLWTDTADVDEDAIFELHEDLARKVLAVDAAHAPATARDPRAPGRWTPRPTTSTCAACSSAWRPAAWRQARAYFDQCLALDPAFAPAWAERGRLDRVLGEVSTTRRCCARPGGARRRSRSIPRTAPPTTTPRSSTSTSAGSTMRSGGCWTACEAVAPSRTSTPRSSTRAGMRGLLDESVAAHVHARRLDPAVPTSVLHTYYMRRRVRAGAREHPPRERPDRDADLDRHGPAGRCDCRRAARGGALRVVRGHDGLRLGPPRRARGQVRGRLGDL